jgi:hypothetical protein
MNLIKRRIHGIMYIKLKTEKLTSKHKREVFSHENCTIIFDAIVWLDFVVMWLLCTLQKSRPRPREERRKMNISSICLVWMRKERQSDK